MRCARRAAHHFAVRSRGCRAVTAWRASLQAALTLLEEEHGVACDDIAMMDVFVTQPTTDDLVAIRNLFDTGTLEYADPAIEDSPVPNLETGIFEEGTPQFEALVGSPTSDVIRAVAVGSFPSYEFRGAGRSSTQGEVEDRRISARRTGTTGSCRRPPVESRRKSANQLALQIAVFLSSKIPVSRLGTGESSIAGSGILQCTRVEQIADGDQIVGSRLGERTRPSWRYHHKRTPSLSRRVSAACSEARHAVNGSTASASHSKVVEQRGRARVTVGIADVVGDRVERDAASTASSSLRTDLDSVVAGNLPGVTALDANRYAL